MASKREKLEAKAKELELVFDEKTTDEELAELIKTKTPPAGDDEDSDDEEKSGKYKGSEVTLVSAGKVEGGPVRGYARTFSAEQHGKNWKKEAAAWEKRFC